MPEIEWAICMLLALIEAGENVFGLILADC